DPTADCARTTPLDTHSAATRPATTATQDVRLIFTLLHNEIAQALPSRIMQCTRYRLLQRVPNRAFYTARMTTVRGGRFSIASAAVLLGLVWSARPESRQSPVNGGHAADAAGAPPTFVGAAACGSCHEGNHDAWLSARHS